MQKLTLLTCILAFCVIVLGAYTRLTDAGLGCPDWPGCYGHLKVPSQAATVRAAEKSFQQTIEPRKAWTEMLHRYLAGSLGVCLIGLAILGLKRKKANNKPYLLPLLIVGVVVLQALLGMWTVTLRLLPPIILLHLFGGLTILSLLWWHYLSQKIPASISTAPTVNAKPWIILGIALLLGQIALGGWTSANYAALICPDFPYCQGKLFPSIDINAFLQSTGIATENHILVSIHMMHRIGAIITGSYLLGLSLWLLLFSGNTYLRKMGLVVAALLGVQISLGILNIVWLLPLWTAVTHNGVAALLLLSLLTTLGIISLPSKQIAPSA